METVHPKTCIICGQPKEEGMTILTEFICSSCETEMVHTETGDEKYPFFVQQLRQLWIRTEA